MRNELKETIIALADDMSSVEEWLNSAKSSLDRLRAIATAEDSGDFGEVVSSLAVRNLERPFTDVELDRIMASVDPPKVECREGELMVDAVARRMAELPHGPEKRMMADVLQMEATRFVRDEIKKSSILYGILPDDTATASMLSRGPNGSVGVSWPRRPDSSGAKWVPMECVPSGECTFGPEYFIPMSRVFSPCERMDMAEISGGLVKFSDILRDSSRGIAGLIDQKLMDVVRSVCCDVDGPGETVQCGGCDRVVNPNRISGKCQWMSGIPVTCDGFTKASKMLPSCNPDGRFACGNSVCVMNERTSMRLIRAVYGPPKRDDLDRGVTYGDLLGIRTLFTAGDDPVKDGEVFFFSDPDSLGKFFKVDDWSAFVRLDAYLVNSFVYFMGGSAIGNTAAVALAQFDMGGHDNDNESNQ